MNVVSPISFATLAALPLVRQYEDAFLKATGVSLALHPAGAAETRVAIGRCENQVCWLGRRPQLTGSICWIVENTSKRTPGLAAGHQTWRCFAGLQTFSAPVVVHDQHVATWVGDHVFARRPTPAELRALAHRLTRWGMADRLPKITEALLHGLVIPNAQFGAMADLLSLFAEHLGQFAETTLPVPLNDEPLIVRTAKSFVAAHLTERVSLRQVAAAANTSPFHLCRVFKTATGVKFTEYVAQLRVHRAKTLLADRSIRVSEVAYAAGFGSIPQFNAVFRRHVGTSPTAYRANELPPSDAPSSRKNS